MLGGFKTSLARAVRHCSVAQIDALVAALELIADEHGRANQTLQMLQFGTKKQVVAGAKSLKSL